MVFPVFCVIFAFVLYIRYYDFRRALLESDIFKVVNKLRHSGIAILPAFCHSSQDNIIKCPGNSFLWRKGQVCPEYASGPLATGVSPSKALP